MVVGLGPASRLPDYDNRDVQWTYLKGHFAIQQVLNSYKYPPPPQPNEDTLLICLYPRVSKLIKGQGVVTYTSPVEAFATGIKMESSDERSF